jgi:HlyD family secretion protein
MSALRRILIIAVGLVTLGAVTGGVYFMLRDRVAQAGEQEPTYRVGVVERGDLRETISVTGPVAAHQHSDLAFILSGGVEEVNVEVGQRVQAGDTLMRLSTTQYELDLVEAEVAVELQRVAFDQLLAGPSGFDVVAARAAVDRSQAQLDQLTQPPDEDAIRIAQANLELRRSDWWLALVQRDKIRTLYGEGWQLDLENRKTEAAEAAVHIAEQELMNAQQGVSTNEIGVSQAAVSQAQAALQRLLEGPTQVDIDLARLQIEQAEVAVQNARASLYDASLSAPFDGVIAEVNYDIGEQASAGLTAVVLLDDSSFHIDVLVDEIDIVRVAVGQLAFIDLDAWPGAEVSGRVVRIAPEGREVNGIVSYEVRVEVDHSSVDIRDGMTATVDIVVSELTDILLVPNWAIRFDRTTGTAFANVRRPDGTVEEVQVEIGVRGASMSEVRAGLQEGDEVVVSLEREGLNIFGEQEEE